MELVQFSKNGDVVTFRVTVNGTLAWRYVYVADNYKFSKTNQDSPPYEHAVGLPNEINNEINTWDFQLGNLSAAAVPYTLEITWMQNGNPIHSWNQSGTITASQKATTVSDSAMLVGV
jgi:hypothetical protein